MKSVLLFFKADRDKDRFKSKLKLLEQSFRKLLAKMLKYLIMNYKKAFLNILWEILNYEFAHIYEFMIRFF